MLSAVISTKESERSLVPTLSALVPASASGLLAEVVIADAGSTDATAEVADIAGCRYISSGEPLGARLKTAAEATRSPWLLFLRAGVVPQPGWVAAVDHFVQVNALNADRGCAAVFGPVMTADRFRPGLAEVLAMARAAIGGAALRPEQGLLISRPLYKALGGHSPDEGAELVLLRRLGRRRTAMLPVSVAVVAREEDT